MDINIRCPHCHEALVISDEEIDLSLECPSCRKSFVWRSVKKEQQYAEQKLKEGAQQRKERARQGYPFTRKPKKPQSWHQRRLGQMPKENAIVEINNLLADAQRVQDVSVEDIRRIADAHGVDIYKKFQGEREAFYRDYLRYCLADKVLTDDELKDLSHLKCILGLSDVRASHIYTKVAESVYQKSLAEVIADSQIDSNEKVFLEKLQRDLNLPEEVVQRIHDTEIDKHLQRCMSSAISDGKLSPEEEEEFHAIARNLGLEITFSEKTESLLDRYRLFWRIEEGELPDIRTDIHLPIGERCHFMCNADWNEYVRETRQVSKFPALAVPFGDAYMIIPEDVRTVSREVLRCVDSGTLYLTSVNLRCKGKRGGYTISLAELADFRGYRDGVEIQRQTGENIFLEFHKDVDIFIRILGRLMRDIG
jgi:phage FluMu protein Com